MDDMSLADLQRNLGATLAPDGIPLHFGDQTGEYQAGLKAVVLMDRSHEGRLELTGRDRFEIIQRTSTNDVLQMPVGVGRATLFTNPTGRILDRITLYNRGEEALALTEPGRGAPVQQYIQRQVFFNDELKLTDMAPSTRLFALHGPAADRLIHEWAAIDAASPLPDCIRLEQHGLSGVVARRKALSGAHWAVIVSNEQAEAAWVYLSEQVRSQGGRPAGSLAYNALRIRAGQPGTGRELTPDYIPLEAGLWDEVSFSKGCYTGQEIIARMESRNKLAKTLVTLRLSEPVNSPAELKSEGRTIGTMTSSVTTPLGEHLGMGFVKVAQAVPGLTLEAGPGGIAAEVLALAGAQPPALVTEPVR
jgi:folate-binding protein YgfZ